MAIRPQKPAQGIMLLRDFGDKDKPCKNYHIECECGSSDHSVKMWIEIDPDHETQDIQISFYADTWTPWWDKYYNRFKCIWKLLTTGVVRYEHHMILNKQAALNLANTILTDVAKLEEGKKNANRKRSGTSDATKEPS